MGIQLQDENRAWQQLLESLTSRINDLERRLIDIETQKDTDIRRLDVSSDSDVSPTYDSNPKKITLQRLASAPSNADYVAFTTSGGTTFYLVLEDT